VSEHLKFYSFIRQLFVLTVLLHRRDTSVLLPSTVPGTGNREMKAHHTECIPSLVYYWACRAQTASNERIFRVRLPTAVTTAIHVAIRSGDNAAQSKQSDMNEVLETFTNRITKQTPKGPQLYHSSLPPIDLSR